MIGRKSIFCEEIQKQALKLAFHGLTILQMAEFFDVGISTFKRWLNKHPLFRTALKREKDIADERVEKSLYKRALGFRYTEKTYERQLDLKTGKADLVLVKSVRKTMPPDTTACIFWQKNRQPDRWRDVQDRRFTGVLTVRAEDLHRSRERVLEEMKRALQGYQLRW